MDSAPLSYPAVPAYTNEKPFLIVGETRLHHVMVIGSVDQKVGILIRRGTGEFYLPPDELEHLGRILMAEGERYR